MVLSENRAGDRMDYNERLKNAKIAMIDIGKRMYQKNFIASNDGNISFKLCDDRYLVTPTGICKGDMCEADLIITDESGILVEGNKKVTSEVKMHLAVYETRSDIKAVVHAHPPKSTAFAACGIKLDKIILPEMIFALGKINLTDYGTPSTTEIPDTVRVYIKDANALLLKNHGALTVGTSLHEAYFAMETLEHYASICLYAHLLGGAVELSEAQVKKLFEVRGDTYGLNNDIFEKQ